MSVLTPWVVPAGAGIASRAVIEEARRRQQRRRRLVGAALLTLAVGGYVGAVRGSGGGTAAGGAIGHDATVAIVRSCPALPASSLVVTTQPRFRGSPFRPIIGLHGQLLLPNGAELWIAPDRAAGTSAGTFCPSS